MIHFIATAVGGGVALQLNDADVTDLADSPDNSAAGWRFNDDGTLDKRTNVASVATYTYFMDWIVPLSAVGDGSGFEVRFIDFLGDALQISTFAEDVWGSIDNNPEFSLLETTNGNASKNCTLIFEIRTGSSGGAEDTLTTELTATVTL